MTVKNFRHGRLYIVSGDLVPLTKIVTFSGGTFTFNESRERNIVRDRGEPVEATPGDSQTTAWGFGAKYEDKTTFRTVRDGVWDGQAETVVGLTAGAVNSNVALDYDIEQGSLQIAAGDALFPGTKLAIGAAPSSDGEFSEVLGAANVENVITVAKAAAFNIQMPLADVDVDVTYDAVGAPTSSAVITGGCTGAIQYFKLRLDIYNPCDPPSVLDLTRGTVVERIELNNCYLEQDSFQEDPEANDVTFSGQSLDEKVTFITV